MGAFNGQDATASTPASSVRVVDVSAGDVIFSPPMKSLLVQGGGNIVLRAADDHVDVAIPNVVAGQILPIRIAIIRKAGTTATNMFALTEVEG